MKKKIPSLSCVLIALISAVFVFVYQYYSVSAVGAWLSVNTPPPCRQGLDRPWEGWSTCCELLWSWGKARDAEGDVLRCYTMQVVIYVLQRGEEDKLKCFYPDKWTLHMEEKRKCCAVTESAASSREKRTEKPPSDPPSPLLLTGFLFWSSILKPSVKTLEFSPVLLDRTQIIHNWSFQGELHPQNVLISNSPCVTLDSGKCSFSRMPPQVLKNYFKISFPKLSPSCT